MWFERFVIIVTSVHRDFLTGSWGYFSPTINDVLLFVGTIGLFIFLFLLFIRFLPAITMFEVKAVLPEADVHTHPNLMKFAGKDDENESDESNSESQDDSGKEASS
jgi:hypothetical protein